MKHTALLFLPVILISFAYATEVVAHRGFTNESNENTLSSIHEAWRYDAPAVEVDIQLLKDGNIVLFHDSEIKGRSLSELDYSELQRLTPEYHIPTITEALAQIPASKSIILDLKSNSQAFASALCARLTESELDFGIIIQSPDLRVLDQIARRLSDGVSYHYLTKLERRGITGKKPTAEELIANVSSSKVHGVSAKGRRFIDQSFIESIQNAGLTFYVWTINDPERIRHYAALGVDGIITDNPEAREVIENIVVRK